MFIHLFSYRLRCLLRNRTLVFWTLLYPLFMATVFFLAFGNLMHGGGGLEPIPVAVVDDAGWQENSGWQQMLTALAKPGPEQLLQPRVVPQTEAEQLLEQDEVTGVITLSSSGPELLVKQSGMNQSMLKAILDDYLQSSSMVTRILQQNPQAAATLLPALSQHTDFTSEISFSSAEPKVMFNYFYALVAMTCLFGGFWGLENSTQTQANLSGQGMRRSVTPTHKLQVVWSDAAAAFTITLLEVLLLLAYLTLVLGVGFGSQLVYILLVCIVGSLAGVSVGTFIGTVMRQSEGVKIGLLVGSNLMMSFLAGLMFVNMKDIVAQKLPILSYINPAALITDALYSLYIFESHHRFWLNLGLLGLITVALCTVSYVCLRRERYVSL